MDEPPSKRAKRTDERTESQPSSSRRDAKPRSRYEGDRDQARHHRREDDHRKRSRSRDNHDKRRERSRSRERPRRDRDRDRDRERDRDRGAKDRNVNGAGHRDRSRSRDKDRSSKDFRTERSHRRSRSRSPLRDGGSGSVRTRSPPRRSDHDRGARPREPTKAEEGRSTPKAKPGPPTDTGKPSVNGDSMAVDEDDEDALLRKMMGFTTFKTTQNTKIPGNQIYGVRKEKKTEYRQYMNRVGGFNRPLSPSR